MVWCVQVYPRQEVLHLQPRNVSSSAEAAVTAFTFSMPPHALMILNLDLDLAPASVPKLSTRNPYGLGHQSGSSLEISAGSSLSAA